MMKDKPENPAIQQSWFKAAESGKILAQTPRYDSKKLRKMRLILFWIRRPPPQIVHLTCIANTQAGVTKRPHTPEIEYSAVFQNATSIFLKNSLPLSLNDTRQIRQTNWCKVPYLHKLNPRSVFWYHSDFSTTPIQLSASESVFSRKLRDDR